MKNEIKTKNDEYMNRVHNIPELNTKMYYLTVPGTGSQGVNICPDIEERMEKRIKLLKKEQLL